MARKTTILLTRLKNQGEVQGKTEKEMKSPWSVRCLNSDQSTFQLLKLQAWTSSVEDKSENVKQQPSGKRNCGTSYRNRK